MMGTTRQLRARAKKGSESNVVVPPGNDVPKRRVLVSDCFEIAIRTMFPPHIHLDSFPRIG